MFHHSQPLDDGTTSSMMCVRDDRWSAKLWWLSSRLGTKLGTRHPIRVLEETLMEMILMMMRMPMDLQDQEDLVDQERMGINLRLRTGGS